MSPLSMDGLRRAKAKIVASFSSKKSDDRASESQIETCRLLTLPAELRNRIYELTLQSEEPLELRNLAQPPLTLTCRQIQAEALPILFTSNAFTYTILYRGRYTCYNRLKSSTALWTSRTFNSGIKLHVPDVVFRITDYDEPGSRLEWVGLLSTCTQGKLGLSLYSLSEVPLEPWIQRAAERSIVRIVESGKGLRPKDVQNFFLQITAAPLGQLLQALFGKKILRWSRDG